MWFGDLVTMRWFNDVWMKEVFANFMAAKIVNPSFPEINHELRFLLAYYPAAYDVDRTAGTNAIRQPLENLNEAGTLYGAIIYQKAPIVMRQLEMILGEEPIPRRPARVPARARVRQRDVADLIALLDARTPEDLRGVEPRVGRGGRAARASRPSCVSRTAGSRGSRSTQRDPVARRGLVWNQRLQVALGYDDEIRARSPCSLNAARVEVAGGARAAGAAFVLPNGGGIGYGEFALDAASRAWLLAPPARHRRRADARERVGHALGRDARRPSAAPPTSSRCSSRRCRASATS